MKHIVDTCPLTKFEGGLNLLRDPDDDIWSPHYNYAIDNIEAVQRKFTKRLKGCKDMEYPARLSYLHLHRWPQVEG